MNKLDNKNKVVVNINNVTKDYKNNRGNFNISFNIKENEVVGIAGENGAGKTTLIRQIMGFIKSDIGNIQIYGLDAYKESAKIKNYIGYVPGEINFPDVKTGYLFLKNYAKSRNIKDFALADKLISRLQLDIRAYPKRMSKGMKQKMAIVSAFMTDAPLIILDEPTTGLDPLMREVLLSILLEEKEKGKTIFISSNSIEELERVCDRVFFISQGKIINEADVNKIKNVSFRDYKIEFKKEYVFPILITSILIILTLPNDYMFKVLFQESYLNIPTPIDLNYTHRIMIYLAFILPVIYFVLLYKFDIPHRRAFLTFISFMALFSYIAIRRYETWSSVGALPLHLCNTAMYIIPLTLVFKSHKVFYFTMFINVIGAFLALLMPNYDINGIFSSYTIEFFINHLYAFFMPILIVLLGVYERPKTKYFMYSMIGFFLYFVLCVTLNTIYGSNFFFLNDDFIVSKLGSWAEDIFRDFYFTVEVNGSLVEIRYLYLIIFYLIYVVLALFMWFIYEILFKGIDSLTSLYEKNVKYNENKLNFIKLQKEKGVDMNKINYKDIQNKPATLDIIHLKKKYGKNDFYTIKDFSLHLEGGKIYGFLGKNGAGKSTIIKSIVGMHTFDGGEIKACGFDVVYQEVEAKSCIGFVPDHYALYESLTGRQYINYIADLYDVSLEDRNTRLDELLNKLELKDKFDKQIRTYSHGMKQKLTIIGALIHNPKIWILDEPMTGVDPNSIYQIKECMKDHAKKGNIVFFSSHLIDVVKNLCDEVIIIKHGDFIMRDSVENLNKNNVDLEKLFLEMTADNKEEENKLLNELEAAK